MKEEKKMIKIDYSDVCENNNVINRLKEYFNILPTDSKLYYGSAYAMYNDTKINISIDRHKNSYGNQYIEFYTTFSKKIKAPLNTSFDLNSIYRKLDKITKEEKTRQQKMQSIQDYRKRVYLKFNEINKNDKLYLDIKSNETIEIIGQYEKYVTKHFSYLSHKEQIKEIEKHYINYEIEQNEINNLLCILGEIKK